MPGWGASLLVIGFLAQFAASVMDDEPDWLCLPVAFAGAATIAVLASVLLRYVVRPYFTGRAMEAAFGAAWREHQRDYADSEGEVERRWWRDVEVWRYRLGKPRHADETIPAYGRRLLGERRWSRAAADKRPPPDDYESSPAPDD
jgi:hypothetical protein